MLAKLVPSWANAVLPVSDGTSERSERKETCPCPRQTCELAGKLQEEQSDFHWCSCRFPSAAAKHVSTRCHRQSHLIKNPSISG